MRVIVIGTLRFLENRKCRADADIDINVGRTIERVENDRVFGTLRHVRHNDGMFILFRGQNPDTAPRFQTRQHCFVGIDIKLLLDLALDVPVQTVDPQNVGQTGPTNFGLDFFAGQSDCRQQK